MEQSVVDGGGAQSLGGVVVRALGRIPVLGERCRLGDLELTVIDAEPSRVLRLLVERASTIRSIALERVR
jgi:CBS domain containing-hemolysin-like protein